MTHPITPPPELVQQWPEQAPRCRDAGIARENWLVDRAAQWGADQELEACCEWLRDRPGGWSNHLRAARRPKPPSLKEQALEIIERGEDDWQPLPEDWATLRRALEALPDG